MGQWLWAVHGSSPAALRPSFFPQEKCTRLFQGHVASIHSRSVNKYLRKQAQSCTDQAQVWIGGVISYLGRRAFAHWVDQTNWNYAHWASGNPSPSGKTCIALCPAGGHWRSASCETRLPYICEY